MACLCLQIIRGDPDYRVRLTESDGATTEDVLPRSAITQAVWSPTRITARVANAPPAHRDHQDYQEIAETLYGWLLPPGPIRERWKVLDGQDPPQLHLEIPADSTDTEAVEFAGLPWELASTDRLALTNGICRMTRAERVNWQVSPWPFRILLVIGATPQEQEELGIVEEIRSIERTFLPLGRSVDVHRLDRPDRDTLRNWVKMFHPHVFHFAGHGGKLPGSPELGLLTNPAGREPWVWSGDGIRIDLKAWRWSPRFVFLNACRSGVELEGARSAQRGFLDRGTQAVLGMQADIQGQLAGKFAARFYQECAAGKTLEEAVFEARSVLGSSLASYRHIDWALPSLAFSSPGIRLVQPQPAPDAPEFRDCREFLDARFFADCREPRRSFTHWLYPAQHDAAAQQNVLLVKGESKSGKSHLLKWCMETWALGGARVRYIELHEQSRTFLDVLRQIRNGEADGTRQSRYLHDPLPDSAFRRFKWELKNILEKGEPGEWVDSEHVADGAIAVDASVLPANGDKRLEPVICARFVAALKTAAGARPLVLVFDRLGGPNNERTLFAPDFEQLIQGLFLPIARDKGSQIKLAFGATFSEARDYRLDLLANQDLALTWEVPNDFPEERLVELAAEAVWFEKEPKVTDLARSMLRFKDAGGTVGLGRLKSFIEFVRQLSEFHMVRMR